MLKNSKWLKTAKEDPSKKNRDRFKKDMPWLFKGPPYAVDTQETTFGNPYKGAGGSPEGGSYDEGGASGINPYPTPFDYGQSGN